MLTVEYAWQSPLLSERHLGLDLQPHRLRDSATPAAATLDDCSLTPAEQTQQQEFQQMTAETSTQWDRDKRFRQRSDSGYRVDGVGIQLQIGDQLCEEIRPGVWINVLNGERCQTETATSA